MVGDVHGCADELHALVREADADQVVLVGDLFTKGPDPVGVWDLVREGPMHAVLGNHDQRLLDVVDGKRDRDDHGHAVVEQLYLHDPSWLPWMRRLPLTREVAGWTVVHAALHPTGSIQATTREIATLLRRWPHDDPDDPKWWEVYRGDRRVVFGHDARQGFVLRRRFGVPWVVGLDTGCVYGGRLSGWLLEEERVLQVNAARAYMPIKRRVS